MNEKKRLIKNTGIIAIGNLSTKLVSFFLLPLYTALLSTEEYGTFDYILSIATFCVPFVSVLMDESIFRFLIDCKTEKEKKKVISTSVAVVFVGMICFTIVGIPIMNF
jgi:Polysaccharide biosynthesis protein.